MTGPLNEVNWVLPYLTFLIKKRKRKAEQNHNVLLYYILYISSQKMENISSKNDKIPEHL